MRLFGILRGWRWERSDPTDCESFGCDSDFLCIFRGEVLFRPSCRLAFSLSGRNCILLSWDGHLKPRNLLLPVTSPRLMISLDYYSSLHLGPQPTLPQSPNHNWWPNPTWKDFYQWSLSILSNSSRISSFANPQLWCICLGEPWLARTPSTTISTLLMKFTNPFSFKAIFISKLVGSSMLVSSRVGEQICLLVSQKVCCVGTLTNV